MSGHETTLPTRDEILAGSDKPVPRLHENDLRHSRRHRNHWRSSEHSAARIAPGARYCSTGCTSAIVGGRDVRRGATDHDGAMVVR